jgi:phage tail sheath gpL-like
MTSSLFAANDPVPGTKVKINFGAGASTTGASARKVLLVGPMLSTGAEATVNTLYKVTKESEIETLVGSGGPLHICGRGALQAWRRVQLYILPTAPSSGVGLVNAESVVRLDGTATKSGSVKLTLSNNIVTVGFSSGDTDTEIGDDLEASINSVTHLPCTGSNTDGYVTLTAKLAGASQNENIRNRVEITPGCGITASIIDAETHLVGGVDGAVTETAGITTALSTIENEMFYYIIGTTNTAASIVNNHVLNKAEPDPGLRSVGIVGFVGEDIADANAIALGLNFERMQIVAQQSGETTGEYLAGVWGAIRAKEEFYNKRKNFAGYALSTLIPRVYESNDFITTDELRTAVESGVTVVQSGNNGSYVVRSVTTASKNSLGTINDFRKLDSHIVSVADDIADTISILHSNNYNDYALVEDQLLADGVTVDTSQKIPPRTLVPSKYKPWLRTQLLPYFINGQITKFNETAESIYVQVDESVKTKLNVEFDLYVIPLLLQTGFTISESSEG